MDAAAWERELDEVATGSVSHGRVNYLVDGDAFFPALIHAIGQARHAIRMRLYIFDNDDYALKVADLLKARSKEIDVQILVDGFGTIAGGLAQPDYRPQHARLGPASIVAYLQADSAVEVRTIANPWMQGDHTKVIIVDDRVAFLGGMNIGREYRYEWHDLMAGVNGPVVDRLIRDFEDAWVHAGPLGDLQVALQRPAHQVREPSDDDYPMRLLYTRPMDSQILRAQIRAMRRARQRVWLENAYLTSDAILYELLAARRRGVDVRVVVPYRTDAGVISRSNVLAVNLLLQNGIRVFVYPGMSHVKAAVYDGWACLGSANFDKLSLRLNKETNIATSHPPAVQRLVDEVFLPDFARAVELTEPLPASWFDYLNELIADHL
jgi:cardiolipin synthase